MPTLRKYRAKINRLGKMSKDENYDKIQARFEFVFTEGMEGFKSRCKVASYVKAKPRF